MFRWQCCSRWCKDICHNQGIFGFLNVIKKHHHILNVQQMLVKFSERSNCHYLKLMGKKKIVNECIFVTNLKCKESNQIGVPPIVKALSRKS